MKFDWTKLTSRKFWMAIAGFVGMLVTYFGGDISESERIVTLIMAGASVIAYIIGEGLVDARSAGATTIVTGTQGEDEGGAESGGDG